MAKYYQDFAGLNTFMYSPGGWFVQEQTGTYNGALTSLVPSENPSMITTFGMSLPLYVQQNHLGWYGGYTATKAISTGIGYFKNHLFPISASFSLGAASLGQSRTWATASFFNSLMIYRMDLMGILLGGKLESVRTL